MRSLRTELEFTQERLAWACELDKGFLSQVESGKRLPSVAVVEIIARRLGVEVADIFAFDLSNARLELLDASRRCDPKAVGEALRLLKA